MLLDEPAMKEVGYLLALCGEMNRQLAVSV
jgi:hypothetical protein